MLSVVAFADEMERDKSRQRTYDALLRKARAGHVTGGRVFGYDNMMICDGSTMPANPGVNPSLTITAISEHAMASVPVKAVSQRGQLLNLNS